MILADRPVTAMYRCIQCRNLNRKPTRIRRFFIEKRFFLYDLSINREFKFQGTIGFIYEPGNSLRVINPRISMWFRNSRVVLTANEDANAHYAEACLRQ
jgi:hypothetical protein